MNTPMRCIRRLLLAAALPFASTLGAQGTGVAPALPDADGGGAPARPVSLLDSGTDALLQQVGALTEPGLDVSDDPVDVPCHAQGVPPELALARQRPETLVWRALWEVRAHRTIRSLNAPLPICFAANAYQPDRSFQNVIRFNSDWMSRPEHRRLEYVLSGYAAPRETSRALGEQRAGEVRQRSYSDLYLRLTPRNGGVSREVGRARWVQYVLDGR